MWKMREAKLVLVQAFNKEWEAEMAKSALNGAGIDAIIQADSVGGNRPDIAFATGGFKVLVREKDVAAAQEALEPPTKHA
jgi:Putative prokaryotic signal transducing protein